MAFINSNNTTEKSFEKATGFINIYISMKNGNKKKLGAIPLKESDTLQNRILELMKSPTGDLNEVVKKMEFDFHLVQEAKEEDFDF